MRPWTPKDLALAGVGNLLTAALTFALIPVMGNLRPISPWLYLGALLALPLAGSAVTAFLLKRRGVRLWGPCACWDCFSSPCSSWPRR